MSIPGEVVSDGADYEAAIAEAERFVHVNGDSRGGIVLLVKRLVAVARSRHSLMEMADGFVDHQSDVIDGLRGEVKALRAENEHLRGELRRVARDHIRVIGEREALRVLPENMTVEWGVSYAGVHVDRWPNETAARVAADALPDHTLVSHLVSPWTPVKEQA